MTVYKNPYVSRPSYFVRTCPAKSAKMEAKKSNGYEVTLWEGKWRVEKAQFYDKDLKEFEVVGKNEISIFKVINNAILKAVLELVGEENDLEKI